VVLVAGPEPEREGVGLTGICFFRVEMGGGSDLSLTHYNAAFFPLVGNTNLGTCSGVGW